jgi:EpsI family protein
MTRSTEPTVCVDRSSYRPDRFGASDNAVIERVTGQWGAAGFVLCCSLALLLALHYATVVSLLAAWSRDPLGHGFFILPGIVALAWRRRIELARLTPTAAPVALLLLAALSLIWLLGKAGDINAIQQVAVLAMCVALPWAVVGAAPVRTLAFPLGLLFFAAPFDDVLAPPLQHMTASVVATMLRWTGLSAALDQHFISTASTRWNVSEACGGIHYVVAALVVGYVYAGLVYRRWRNRAAFIVASAFIPMTGNVLRVYTTVLLDEAGADAVVAGMGHYAYGLVVFAAMMTVLVVTCGRWRDEMGDEARESSLRDDRGVKWATWRTATIVSLAMVFVGASAVSANVFAHPVTEHARRLDRRHVAAPWSEVESSAIRPSLRLSVDALARVQAYTSGESLVALYTAAFPPAAVNLELSRAVDLDQDTLTEGGGRLRSVELPGNSLTVNETVLRSGQATVRLWTWFEIEGRTTAGRRVAKLLFAKARLLGTYEPGLQIAVAMEEQEHVDAVRVLTDFVAHLQTVDDQN